ncbi:hypothetical protein D3C81_1997920 [compost metagenome]
MSLPCSQPVKVSGLPWAASKRWKYTLSGSRPVRPYFFSKSLATPWAVSCRLGHVWMTRVAMALSATLSAALGRVRVSFGFMGSILEKWVVSMTRSPEASAIHSYASE